MTYIENLRALLQEDKARLSAIETETSERAMTEPEVAEVENLTAEVKGITRQLAARDSITETKDAGAPKRLVAAGAELRPARSITSNEKPFKSLGDFALAVRGVRTNKATERMRNALTSYVGEVTDADGGYAVPGEYKQEIDKLVYNQQSFLPLCATFSIGQDSQKVPTDNKMPWAPYSGSGGPAIVAEGGTISQAKPVITQESCQLYKIAHLVPVSNEIRQDFAGINQYILAGAAEALTYKVNQLLLSGSGVNEPKGVLAAGGLKTVASGSGQLADTVIYKNITDMWTAMPSFWRSEAVWVANPNVESQLLNMTVSGAAQPIYVNGNAANSPFGATLLGRPVLYHPGAPALGDKGDLSLVNFKYLWAPTDGAGVKLDYDPFAYFDQDVGAFRWTFRLGATPRLASVITLPDNTTQSAYVTLAPR